MGGREASFEFCRQNQPPSFPLPLRGRSRTESPSGPQNGIINGGYFAAAKTHHPGRRAHYRRFRRAFLTASGARSGKEKGSGFGVQGRHRRAAEGRGRGGGASRAERRNSQNSPRTDTDKHGRARTAGRGRWFFLKPDTRWRGQNAEVRGQEKPENRSSVCARRAQLQNSRRGGAFNCAGGWGRGGRRRGVGDGRRLVLRCRG